MDDIKDIEKDWKDFVSQIEDIIKNELTADIIRVFKEGKPFKPNAHLISLGLTGFDSNLPVYTTIFLMCQQIPNLVSPQ